MSERGKFHRKAFRWGGRFMRCYFPFIAGLSVLSLFIGFLGTLEPVYTGWIIDALTMKDSRKFFCLLIALSCIQIGIMCMSLLNTWLNMRFHRDLTVETESRLFSQILKSPASTGIENQGNLMNLFLSDLSTMTGIYTSLLPSVFVSICTLTVICVRLYMIHRMLLVLTLFFSLVPLLLAHHFGLKQAEIHRQEQIASDAYVGFLEETLPSLRELQSAFSQQLFIGRLGQVLGNLFGFIKKNTIVSLKASTSFFLCNYLTSISLLLVVGFSVLNEDTSIGTLVAAILYSQQIRTIIRSFGERYQELLSHQISTQRLMSMFVTCSDHIRNIYVESQIPSESVSLFIDDLSFSYSCDKHVFRHFSFRFSCPGLYVVKGRNGTGKTTLLNILWRWIPPTAVMNGTVNFIGCKRTEVVYAPQSPTVFSLSVADNLLLGMTMDEKFLWTVLDAVGLSEIVRALPHGLNTILKEDGIVLSKGQCQRLILARCIIQKPKILLLDEIETAIDRENEIAIYNLLSTISTNMLMILATHRDSFDSLASEVIALDE